MADIDRAAFAEAFAASLQRLGMSQGAAARAWPAANAAMISRAMNRQKLEAGNLLLLCSLAGLDPMEFLIVVKPDRLTLAAIATGLSVQTLTAVVKRETQERVP